MEIAAFVPATAVGFYTLKVVTHHNSKLWLKIKDKQYRTSRIQVFPSIRVYTSNRVIHFHHWFNFSLLLLASAFIASPILDSAITRGFLVGGVLQGLSYTEGNARKIIYHKAKDTFAAKIRH